MPEAAVSPDTAKTPIRRAAGIYGLIVTASVLAAAGTKLGTAPLTVAVFTTLLIYWVAEEYAEVGERASMGDLPSWPHIRRSMARKWPMVSASFIPLAVLIGARLVGASSLQASMCGLVAVVAMLVVYGWEAGRTAGLRGWRQLAMTAGAGSLGVLMILLKVAMVHLH